MNIFWEGIVLLGQTHGAVDSAKAGFLKNLKFSVTQVRNTAPGSLGASLVLGRCDIHGDSQLPLPLHPQPSSLPGLLTKEMSSTLERCYNDWGDFFF